MQIPSVSMYISNEPILFLNTYNNDRLACVEKSSLTLAAEDLHPHTGMSVPVDGVKLDKTGYDWAIQVRMLYTIRVHISLKYLTSKHKSQNSKEDPTK